MLLWYIKNENKHHQTHQQTFVFTQSKCKRLDLPKGVLWCDVVQCFLQFWYSCFVQVCKFVDIHKFNMHTLKNSENKFKTTESHRVQFLLVRNVSLQQHTTQNHSQTARLCLHNKHQGMRSLVHSFKQGSRLFGLTHNKCSKIWTQQKDPHEKKNEAVNEYASVRDEISFSVFLFCVLFSKAQINARQKQIHLNSFVYFDFIFEFFLTQNSKIHVLLFVQCKNTPALILALSLFHAIGGKWVSQAIIQCNLCVIKL